MRGGCAWRAICYSGSGCASSFKLSDRYTDILIYRYIDIQIYTFAQIFLHQEGWCLPPDDQIQEGPSPLFNSHQPTLSNFNSYQPAQSNFNVCQLPQANPNVFQPSASTSNLNGRQPSATSSQPPPASPPLPPKTRLRQAPVPPPDWGPPGGDHCGDLLNENQFVNMFSLS